MGIKADNKAKSELAYLLFMSGEMQKEIAMRIGVSQRTIGQWIEKGGWKEKRAARTISRTELINKTLSQINTMLENKDVNADKLTKLASMIEKLDKKGSPALIIDVFMDFGRWLQQQALTDKDLDLDFIKKVTRYQDHYITGKLSLT